MPEQVYLDEMPKLRNYPNIRSLGYVATNYTNRPIEDVMLEIRTYADWPRILNDERVGVDGIFFDETPGTYDWRWYEYLSILRDEVKGTNGLGEKVVGELFSYCFDFTWCSVPFQSPKDQICRMVTRRSCVDLRITTRSLPIFLHIIKSFTSINRSMSRYSLLVYAYLYEHFYLHPSNSTPLTHLTHSPQPRHPPIPKLELPRPRRHHRNLRRILLKIHIHDDLQRTQIPRNNLRTAKIRLRDNDAQYTGCSR